MFEAAIRWVSYDVPRRRRHVFEVLRHVRIALMPIQLLQRTLDECRDDSLKVALRSIVKDLVKYLYIIILLFCSWNCVTYLKTLS